MSPNPPAPLRVIIVVDMHALRHEVEDMLAQHPEFTLIGSCATMRESLILIKNTKPDLLVLGIDLPDGMAFDILEKLWPTWYKVIFIADYEEYALQAFRYGAMDYLLKPFDEVDFSISLQRVLHAQPRLQDQIDITAHSSQENKQQDQLALRSQQSVQIVGFHEICYLQADDCYTTVFLHDGKKVVVSRSLKYYEQLLPGNSFLRIHQSYLVNKFYVGRYYQKEGFLYLKDGTRLPVSVRKKELVRIFFKFW